MPDLFNTFLDEKNFLAAYKRIAAKGSRGGIDRVSVEEFGRKLKRNLTRLRKDIEEDRYVPQAVEAAQVPKFNEENEWRELGLPTVGDKIVQAALLQVLEPLAEKLFLDTSYAYRQGKGHYKAIRRVEHHLTNMKLHWAAIEDIDNFFDTLNHDRLLAEFSKLVNGDERLLALVALWCRSGIVAKDGHWKNVEAGVRQGQVLSPLLANLYLHDLDGFAMEKGWGWVRYADNYLIQCASEEEARQADEEAAAFLRDTLFLKLNRNSTPVRSLEQGFDFLGVFFQDGVRAIAREKMGKIKRKLSWRLAVKGPADLPVLFKDLAKMAEGWRRYYGFLNPAAQFAEIEGWIETGLAELIVKRVQAGVWPREAPEFSLPSLVEDTRSPEEGQKYLAALWHKSLPPVTEKIKKEADKKVGGRRKKHQREQVAAGEIIVTTPGYFVGRRGERIVIRKQQTLIAEIPGAHMKSLTVAIHGVSLSTDVIHYCVSRDAFVHFIDHHGQVVAIAYKPDGVRADLAFLQAKERDTEKGLHLARVFVTGKMKNQLALLKSYAKYRRHRENSFGTAFAALQPEMEALLEKARALQAEAGADGFRQSLMGLEGVFAAKYWKAMSHLLPDGIIFEGRKRQGATDLVNSLLNYGYGILYSQTLNAVIKSGLNSTAGFLHSYQIGKPVLIFDLVEEFRSPVVDRPIFSMLNRRESFKQGEDNTLSEATRKKVAAGVLARLGAEVIHQGRRQTIRETLTHQAMAVRRYLLGQGRYRPFLAKW